MGKILATAPATIPISPNMEDKGSNIRTEEINKAIKATAGTITKTKLSDKIRSEVILSRARICCLNEAAASAMAVLILKSKKLMNSLGVLPFSKRENIRETRSTESNNIYLPVPGYPTLPSNKMAKIWNSIPGLQTATTLGSVKTVVRKWAQTLPR